MGSCAVYLVIGLGQTGFSCVQYLYACNMPCAVFDTRENPPYKQQLLSEFPDVPCFFGRFPESYAHCDYWVMSPGLDYKQHEFSRLQGRDTQIITDLDLWVAAIKMPVVAVTGSNGKSTVTTLVVALLQAAGYRACAVGNIGNPVLDYMDDDMDVYALECSSFQLSLAQSLPVLSSVCLNVSPDHLDVHGSMENYRSAKQKIYASCAIPVVNLEEQDLFPGRIPQHAITYATNQSADYYLRDAPAMMLAIKQRGDVMLVADLSPSLVHHPINVLAALALLDSFNLDLQSCIPVLRTFKGLAHRLYQVGVYHQIYWYNDSKATNVGSAQAALRTLYKTHKKRVIWIAGGQGKGADFSMIQSVISETVKHAFLIGEAQDELYGCCAEESIAATKVMSLEVAVQSAKQLADPEDVVVLAPACASFDMFENYQDRGLCFERLVRSL